MDDQLSVSHHEQQHHVPVVFGRQGVEGPVFGQLDDGDLTAGAGLVVHRVRFDGGLVTNERLGNTFRAAVTLGY